MSTNATPITTLLEKVEDYSITTIELLKLKAIGKSAQIASTILMKLILVIVVALFLFLLNIGLAFLLSKVMGTYYYGFLTMAGIDALVFILLYSFRNQLIKEPLNESFISQILKSIS